MLIRNWLYFIKEAFSSVYRNGWMSLASIGVVAVTLFILGSFILLNINVEYISEDIKQQVEIVAFVDESLASDELDSLRVSLIQMGKVEEVRFVSREDALERLKEQLGPLVEGFEGSERNPLRDSFEIRAIVPEDIPAVAEEVTELPGIARVDYGRGVVEQLFSITGVVSWIGIAFIIGLALMAMFLIANTIKLTVNARAKEIMIMKYVGATEWFVRWPFLIEGILLGFLGALLPTVFLMFIYSKAVAWTNLNLHFLPLVSPGAVIMELAKLLLVLGAVVGGSGSLVSMRRFLKV
ncbi:MAG: Cell division protein FtsX [Syntrophomonadaceae bacterium]|nr:Cell division protein FtsX [Bacillota bacterium]